MKWERLPLRWSAVVLRRRSAKGGELLRGEDDVLFGLGPNQSAEAEQASQFKHELVEIASVDVGSPVDELARVKRRRAQAQPDAQTRLGQPVFAHVFVSVALIDGPLDDRAVSRVDDHTLTRVVRARITSGSAPGSPLCRRMKWQVREIALPDIGFERGNCQAPPAVQTHFASLTASEGHLPPDLPEQTRVCSRAHPGESHGPLAAHAVRAAVAIKSIDEASFLHRCRCSEAAACLVSAEPLRGRSWSPSSFASSAPWLPCLAHGPHVCGALLPASPTGARRTWRRDHLIADARPVTTV